ncbi:MAG TPA: M56 family metallopeptidase [Candidatus Sulfopaludibacter sp.]|jgi:TonB family protein|nr:M56 family metallopeptidase [Candidatus Sulfopaludibacter sp.]
MNTSLLWDNLVAYSLQIGLLVGLAAFIPTALRLRQPQARLIYWYLLLATCLALPALRPWRQEVINTSSPVTARLTPMAPLPPVHRSMPRSELALLLLAGGAAVRLIWLAAGFWKLRRYRLHSHPLEGSHEWKVDADLRISEAIASPVTFGYLKPVILLPGQFPELDQPQQDAILCHEVLHVWRRDWLYTVGEELVRAMFWFHPAIWWLLGEIQLSREQAVDREVVDMTRRRDEYVDALLAIAGAPLQPDLAPAPLFLRKRHLKQRVVSILKEVRMSKTRLISAFAMSLIMLGAACWFVTGAFPLAAEPQAVADGIGVGVEMNGAQLIHRSSVHYPPAAVRNHVEGTVTVQVKLGSTGEVADATILSGPDELRKAVLASVLDWHFSRDSAGATRQITVTFQLPKAEVMTGGVAGGVTGGVSGSVTGGVTSGVIGGIIGSVPSARGSVSPARTGTVRAVNVVGVGDQARVELLARLPVHEGDAFTPEAYRKITDAATQYDEHLSVSAFATGGGDVTVQVAAPQTASMAFRTVQDVPLPPGAIRIGGNVQQTKLTSQPRPVYPPLAKQARISGVVHLSALIGKDGTVKNLAIISGHPLLVQAAMEAVRLWTYEPTLLNGAPVEVLTQIDVNFTLVE